MNCQIIQDSIVDFLFDELSPDKRALFESHLESCQACRSRFEELKATHELVEEADLALDHCPRFRPTQIQERVKTMDTAQQRPPEKSTRSQFSFFGWAWAHAGSIVALFFIGLIFMAISMPQYSRSRYQARSKSRPYVERQDMMQGLEVKSEKRYAPAPTGSRSRLEEAEKVELAPANGKPYDTVFFKDYGVNPFVSTEDETTSTFGMDVDTASYTVTRRWLMDGNLPDRDSVRTEEFINYFDQEYGDTQEAFSIHVEGSRSEFGRPNYHLVKIGIKARDVSFEERKAANMIFVVDVSGSMNRENRLGLVKKSLRRLARHLKDGDKVGLVIYGSQGRMISDLTADRYAIMDAIDELSSGGSTNAEEGLTIAYTMARRGFEEGKINRIILCSDGVANVGRTGARGILKQVKQYAEKGITLTALGFGMGNYNDVMMEQLANNGDGNYYYVDSVQEANRIFRDGATSMLQVMGSDAKIQVEFNPDTVDRFRLLGYENRRLRTEDFMDDSVDAGEVGVGQTVTALYEVRVRDDLRDRDDVRDFGDSLLGTARIRYRNVDTRQVEHIERVINVAEIDLGFANTSPRFRFTAAVAEFAEILKESYWAKDGSLDHVLEVAREAAYAHGAYAHGAHAHDQDNEKDLEFLKLVRKAIVIKQKGSSPSRDRKDDEGFEDYDYYEER